MGNGKGARQVEKIDRKRWTIIEKMYKAEKAEKRLKNVEKMRKKVDKRWTRVKGRKGRTRLKKVEESQTKGIVKAAKM